MDAGLLGSCMQSASCQPLELLVRTSGEVRLSDFLLWESSYSVLSFVGVLWPDFSRWDLYAAVLYYQRSMPLVQVREKLLTFTSLNKTNFKVGSCIFLN